MFRHAEHREVPEGPEGPRSHAERGNEEELFIY